MKRNLRIRFRETGEEPDVQFKMDIDVCKDFVTAVKMAVKDWVNTKKGHENFCGKDFFGWMEVWDQIPNTICEKYGFTKVRPERDTPALAVSMNDNLAENPEEGVVPFEEWQELKRWLLRPTNKQNRADFARSYTVTKRDKKLDYVSIMSEKELEDLITEEWLDCIRLEMPLNVLDEWYRKMLRDNMRADKDVMYECPKCGGKSFEVTAHVTQDWRIDGNKNFLEELESCVEVIHEPNDDDIWTCANCGYSAAGREFRNE